jgi:hypothetical protein
MARTRAALTDKQEKILIQCQLMGMTTADMVKISNRLRAIDAEREFRIKVDEVVQGMTWTKPERSHYIVTDSKGLVYDCKYQRKYSNHWNKTETWEIKVNHPGTRMKEKVFKEKNIWSNGDEAARLCPDNDKRLYRLLKAIKNGNFS